MGKAGRGITMVLAGVEGEARVAASTETLEAVIGCVQGAAKYSETMTQRT